MDIKELNKPQLILLTLLITFVVSIATGIVTVSLMQQIPKAVPQTINNVIQRTIEKVTTVQVPSPVVKNKDTKESTSLFGDGDAVVSIYASDAVTVPTPPGDPTASNVPAELPKALGEGIIISDVGLVLVDSTILTDTQLYKVVLNKIDFDATVLKKFDNGFAILKITQKKATVPTPTTPVKDTPTVPKLDNQ
jgi:hypothetical protein